MSDLRVRSPLVDFFFRGEVARDVRMLAARGALAPGPIEQLALLVLLSDDTDAEVASVAVSTIDGIPRDVLAGFLARPEVTREMRAFFAARGVEPAAVAAPDSDAPLVPVAGDDAETPETDDEYRLLSTLPVTERVKLAMRGTRGQRAILIRDPNRLVASAVLSSPKLMAAEVEVFTKMGNVSEEVLRIIATNRNWIKNYSIVASLVRNPKTPPALSMRFVPRLVERDLKGLTVDRNVPEALRQVARKALTKSKLGG